MPLPSPDCSSSSKIAPGLTFLTDAKVPANCKYISINANCAERLVNLVEFFVREGEPAGACAFTGLWSERDSR